MYMLYHNNKVPCPVKCYAHRDPHRATGNRNNTRPIGSEQENPVKMVKPPIKSDTAKQWMQLKVSLWDRPSIWRRLLVPADIKLPKLHAVLQASMGWTDSHLHRFSYEQTNYEPAFQMEEAWDPDESQDEAKVRLSAVLNREGDWLLYQYDFGDNWEHEVRVEKLLPAPPSRARQAVCLAGARACPPEDCGGISGYERMLKILAHPKHREHDETLQWLGESFDPVVFDIARVNTALRKLKI